MNTISITKSHEELRDAAQFYRTHLSLKIAGTVDSVNLLKCTLSKSPPGNLRGRLLGYAIGLHVRESGYEALTLVGDAIELEDVRAGAASYLKRVRILDTVSRQGLVAQMSARARNGVNGTETLITQMFAIGDDGGLVVLVQLPQLPS